MLTGKTIITGLIGWPIDHSLSPSLHGYWLDRYKIDGAYIPVRVHPDDFEIVLHTLAKMGFSGVNITVPYKEIAWRIVDKIEDTARDIGALNTLVIQKDGSVFGRNTDVYGFMANLRQYAPHWNVEEGPTVVLGAGGAARAVIVALLKERCSEIRLVNRTKSRAERLAKDFNGCIDVIDWKNRSACLAGARMLINASSLGMTGHLPLEIDLSKLSRSALVTDIVYTPLLTPLLVAARNRGNITVDGLGMLLHQAVPGFEAWFGIRPEVTEDLRHHVLNNVSFNK